MLDLLKPNLLVEKRKSEFNGTIEVWRSWGLGRYFQVGGLTQSGWIIQKIWGQTLKRVKKLELKVNHCLILGLGGGSLLKPLKNYFPKAKITGVEIDPVMVELGTKYLGLDTTGIKVLLKDACRLDKSGNYDLIIVDLYQGNKIPAKFESNDYLRLIKSHLSKSGVVIFNRLYDGKNRKKSLEFGEKLKKYPSSVDYFYPSANLMLICR